MAMHMISACKQRVATDAEIEALKICGYKSEKIKSNSTSRYRGVSKRSRKWYVSIGIRKVKESLGVTKVGTL